MAIVNLVYGKVDIPDKTLEKVKLLTHDLNIRFVKNSIMSGLNPLIYSYTKREFFSKKELDEIIGKAFNTISNINCYNTILRYLYINYVFVARARSLSVYDVNKNKYKPKWIKSYAILKRDIFENQYEETTFNIHMKNFNDLLNKLYNDEMGFYEEDPEYIKLAAYYRYIKIYLDKYHCGKLKKSLNKIATTGFKPSKFNKQMEELNIPFNISKLESKHFVITRA